MADRYTRLRELFGYEPALEDDDGGDGWTDGDRRWWVRFAAMPSLVRALLAERDALQAKVEAAWRPIETAPTDGTVVLGSLPDSDVPQPVRFRSPGWRHAWDDYRLGELDTPTHWMPLPASPAARAALAQPTGEKP